MNNVRVYSQLAPNESSVNKLINLQNKLQLKKGQKRMRASEFHLTIIHFGKSWDVFKTVNAKTGVAREVFDAHLETFITRCEASIPSDDVLLTHTSYAKFGLRGQTLVAKFRCTDELRKVHAHQLMHLQDFFMCCGINDVDIFMANDPNFKYALSLEPHITIQKGYQGGLPTDSLDDITCHFMPMRYPA